MNAANQALIVFRPYSSFTFRILRKATGAVVGTVARNQENVWVVQFFHFDEAKAKQHIVYRQVLRKNLTAAKGHAIGEAREALKRIDAVAAELAADGVVDEFEET